MSGKFEEIIFALVYGGGGWQVRTRKKSKNINQKMKNKRQRKQGKDINRIEKGYLPLHEISGWKFHA